MGDSPNHTPTKPTQLKPEVYISFENSKYYVCLADYSKHGSSTIWNIGKNLPNYTASLPINVESDNTNCNPKTVRTVFGVILEYGSYDVVARRTSGHNSWSSHTVVAAL
jgi:hypothetical protein